MVSRDELKEHFSNMGASLTDVTLHKCEELCLAYSVDEEELAETWMAYSCSKSLDIDPTVDALNQMERAEFGNRKKAASVPLTPSSNASLVVYNSALADDSFEDDILTSYSATPKAKNAHKKISNTPDHRSSPRVIFSPASFSPNVSTPSARYATRKNSGAVLATFGSAEKANWYSSTPYLPSVKIVSSVPSDSCYMFDTLRERATLHEDNMKFLTKVLCSKAGISDILDMTQIHMDVFESCGRVCYTTGSSLSDKNVCLESLPGLHKSCIVPMDVKEVSKLSLFPGQVVAIKATNPTRSQLVVKDIISDATMPLSDEPLHLPVKDGALQVVIVSGPYTPTDTMTYQPFEDFVDYLKKHRPHVAILIGPFVSADHTHVKDGLLAETFESFFEKQVDNLMQSVAGLQMQVILVSSACDVHHHPVFPTPAYTLKKNYANLHLLGDPCVLDVDGLKIGVTSVDVLKHIGNEEIVNAAYSQDRLGRIAKHILMQNNFYPLYPPNESLNLDTKLWYDYCHLQFTPHILVLPSDLRAFIKEAFGCVLVNPEHLAKGLVGGSFARLEIKAVEKWNPSCVAGQIVKI
ncbi:hypothetical protein R5R35_008442 [Gryllus longicercus]|uniref:DNA polymerase alpha subunit B n=1 Tax=Gryllus longicercus TaxID=2509291 RepID=A0AAN9ZAM1_9ORTH